MALTALILCVSHFVALPSNGTFNPCRTKTSLILQKAREVFPSSNFMMLNLDSKELITSQNKETNIPLIRSREHNPQIQQNENSTFLNQPWNHIYFNLTTISHKDYTTIEDIQSLICTGRFSLAVPPR